MIDTGQNFVQTGAISGTGKYVQVFMVGRASVYLSTCAKQA